MTHHSTRANLKLNSKRTLILLMGVLLLTTSYAWFYIIERALITNTKDYLMHSPNQDGIRIYAQNLSRGICSKQRLSLCVIRVFEKNADYRLAIPEIYSQDTPFHFFKIKYESKLEHFSGDMRLEVINAPSLLHFLLLMVCSGLMILPISFVAYYFKIQADKRKAAQKLNMINEKLQNESKLSNLARQVSHDIKSPLAALEFYTKSMVGLSSEYQKMIQESLTRIKNITDDLLKKNSHDSHTKIKERAHVQDAIKSIIREKKILFNDVKGPQIVLSVDDLHAIEMFLDVSSFKRALSNLLNNAIDACIERDKPNIGIYLYVKKQELMIQIKDNGKGIPEPILCKLKTTDFTYGKNDGHGLGLKQVRAMAHDHGGELTIDSTENVGTCITILMPLQTEESVQKQLVVHVDNDELINKIWEISARKNKIKMLSFNSPDEVLKRIKDFNPETIFYIDHDLEHELTGIDLAKQLNDAGLKKLYLCTGHEVGGLSIPEYIIGVMEKAPPWE